MAVVPEISMIDKLTQQVIGCLTDEMCVLLTGLPGSGRSYLVQSVINELTLSGLNVVSLTGNRALNDKPLSALSMAGLEANGDKKPPSSGWTLTDAASQLRVIADRPNSVLVIDNADEMDQASVGLIIDLRARRNIPLLFVSTVGLVQNDSVMSLIAAAQPGVTVTMDEMRLEEVASLIDSMLPGIVDVGIISKVASLSGGLPGLVRAITLVNSHKGSMLFESGVWRGNGDLWDDGLSASLLPFLRELTSEDVDCLARLAQAGEVSQSAAWEMIGQKKTREFFLRGLLRFNQVASSGGVYVFPPALGELLRRQEQSIDTGDQDREIVVFPANAWPPELVGLEAASLATRILAHWSAEIDQYWKRWVENKIPKTAIPLLVALFAGSADHEKVIAVFEETDRDENQDLFVEFLALQATYHALWMHDLPTALTMLERYRQLFPQHDPYLRGNQAHLILVCDRVPAHELVESSSSDPDEHEMLIAAQIERLIAEGRTQDALELLTVFTPYTERVVRVKQTFMGLVLLLNGELEKGVEWAISCLRDSIHAMDPRSISGHSYVAALGMSMLGQFDEVTSLVELVYRLVDMNPLQAYFKVGLFSLGAFVADWEGRRRYAHGLAVQVKLLRTGHGPFPAMLRGLAQLFATSVQQGKIWDEVDDLITRGYVTNAVFLAVAAAEMEPDAARAAAAIELGDLTQSPVIRALARYVAVIVSGGAEGFEEVVKDLSRVCGPLDVTRARVSWALALREKGDLSGWLEQARSAWEASRRVNRPCDGLFTRLVSAVNLTNREAEVVGYSAQGQSSSEVGAVLGVSTRTVETHLQSVYRKTGVGNRDELRQIVKMWLTL